MEKAPVAAYPNNGQYQHQQHHHHHHAATTPLTTGNVASANIELDDGHISVDGLLQANQRSESIEDFRKILDSLAWNCNGDLTVEAVLVKGGNGTPEIAVLKGEMSTGRPMYVLAAANSRPMWMPINLFDTMTDFVAKDFCLWIQKQPKQMLKNFSYALDVYWCVEEYPEDAAQIDVLEKAVDVWEDIKTRYKRLVAAQVFTRRKEAERGSEVRIVDLTTTLITETRPNDGERTFTVNMDVDEMNSRGTTNSPSGARGWLVKANVESCYNTSNTPMVLSMEGANAKMFTRRGVRQGVLLPDSEQRVPVNIKSKLHMDHDLINIVNRA